VGVSELERDKLTPLPRINYQNSLSDALADLGSAEEVGAMFCGLPEVAL
jgi:type I restriction enzyme R subunit